MLWLIRVRRLFQTVGREALILWYALRHPGTPAAIKLATVLMALYLFSPLDIIPDFAVLFGWADDLMLLLVGTNTAASIAPHLIRLAYDPLKDLDPVGLIVLVPNVLVVSQSVPANNVSELLGLIRSKPGTFQYASSGVGSTQHIAGAAFVAQTGVSAVHVPYKGSAQAHVDLISGQVQMMFDTSSSITPQVKTGRVRPLAVMTARRSAELPDVPTLEEAGVKGLEMSTWYGMFVTGGTPPSIRNALTTELRRVVALPDVAKKLRDLGGDPGAMTQAEFAAFNRSEFERYGKLLKEANIKLDQ